MTIELNRTTTALMKETSLASARECSRILVVGPMPPTKGGVTTFMLNLMASRLNQEFEFIPFTTSRPPKRDVIDNCGYRSVLRGGPWRICIGILITLWHLVTFPIVIIGKRVHLVQIQASDYQVFWEATLYALIARSLGRPVVFRIGGAFDRFYSQSPALIRRWIAAALRLPQCVIAQSHFWVRCIRQAGRDGLLVVVPNWVPEASIVNTSRTPSDSPVFLFIAGTEARRKGIEELLEAVEWLDRDRCPAKFHLVAMTPSLMERINALGLSNIRAMDGPVQHRRVMELRSQADVMLLPSHGEGFPNSLIEAMAAGMASIVTPVGAVPEIVADGGALTIPVGDSKALSAAITLLAGDAELRQRLGREAREAVLARYTEARALPALADAYRSLLQTCPART